jgi:hypothetical protein
LAQSRERLRQALQQVSTSSADVGVTGADGFLGGLLDSLPTTPGASLLGDVLAAWWRKQPLLVALPLVMETANALVQPVARRHPYRLVLGAAAAGGLLVLARPWRWISTPALVAALLPQIVSKAMQHLPPKPRVATALDRHESHP